ncbi:MAG: class I SAM-dependent methyltransferase [Alphaproteobacteria bacterium]|nr:class I SAM-dependent methyltransferase [Alphaproteobacteria bacterium]MBF0332503.1 class I SAM-dependent methyltransferase [Alphaproteobacteria bacterium]
MPPDTTALRAELEAALHFLPLSIPKPVLRAVNAALLAEARTLIDDSLVPNSSLFAHVLSFRHEVLHHSLRNVLGDRVAYGLFQGMILSHESAGSHALPRLIGSYEHELQAPLAARVPACERVVDLGAAEGWYVVGLARRFGKPVLGFDVSAEAREIALRGARANGVEGLVSLEGECAPERLTALARPGTLFIVDIEGAETALFGATEPAALAAADFVVETHGRSALGLVEHFAATHDIEVVWPETRPIAAYPVLRRLQEIDRAVAQWEGRGVEPWLIFTSRER